VHTGQPWLQCRGFNSLQAKKPIGCVGGHAIGLNSWTGTEDSPVSSLKCDMWQRLNLESCLTAVCATSGILMFQATRAVSRPSGRGLLGGRPATGSPMGARRSCGGGEQAGLPGTCVAWHKTNKAGLKLGALLNTVQGSLSLHIMHTYKHTHTHTQGCTMGLPIWPWHCGLIARHVSGVDLTETNKLPPCCPVILEHCSGCVGYFAHRLQGCFLYMESTTCFSLQQGKALL